MPSLVVTGLAQAIRADHDNLPWLDVTYDAQGGTHLQTRLEAFMFQARQFQSAQSACMIENRAPRGWRATLPLTGGTFRRGDRESD